MEAALKLVKQDNPQRLTMSEQYFQVPNFVIDSGIWAKLSPAAKAIYPVIPRKTNGWGKEFDAIAIKQLMALSGVKKDATVTAAVAELEAVGLLEVVRQQGVTSKYKTVSNHPRLEVVPVNGGTTSKRSEPPPVNGGGLPPVKGGLQKKLTKETNTKEKYITHFAAADASPVAEIPVPAKQKKQSTHGTSMQLLADHGVAEQIAKDYLTVRADKRSKTLTATAMASLANQAKAAGLTVEQAVRVCIDRNWVGFNAQWLKSSGYAATSSVKAIPNHVQGGDIQL